MKTRRLTRSMTTLHRNTLPIPDELVFEIYSRLPLTSIARCRCVCKLWSSMLRHQDFTDFFSTRSCARPRILFACTDVDAKKLMFSSVLQPQNLEGNNLCDVPADHLAPFSTYSRCLGCTNGFFLYYDIRFSEGLRGSVTVTVIGNPSTGQSLTLPRLKSRVRNEGTLNLLGYDPIAKEFKVLSVAYQCVKNCISMDCHVLTLGTKRLSWRKVQCCIPHVPSLKSICISGVLYYKATATGKGVPCSTVVCFDLRTEKFSCVEFSGVSSKAKPASQTLVNFDGRLGLLMSEDFSCVYGGSKSFELWVLRDTAKHEWTVHVYLLPLLWKDVVTETMYIDGMVGTNEIVMSTCNQTVHSYVIYYNVETKAITKVGVQGIESFLGKDVHICLNYVENVKLL